MKLNDLRDNPGSRLKSKRLGRGIGSSIGFPRYALERRLCSQRRSSSGFCRQPDPVGYRRVGIEAGERQVDSCLLSQPADQLDHQHRVAAEFEEVIVDADGVHTQPFLP